jgi:hypothetical protein
MEDKVSWFWGIKKAGEKWILCSFFKGSESSGKGSQD